MRQLAVVIMLTILGMLLGVMIFQIAETLNHPIETVSQ